jgi:hypothetical protein
VIIRSNAAFVLLFTLLAFDTALPPWLMAREPATGPASYAGCYEIKMGRWWPWGFGEDNKFVAPAKLIELSTEVETEGFGKGYFTIRSIPPAPPGGPSLYWLLTRDDHLVLVWNGRFTGVNLDLRRGRTWLRGWAHPHFDTPQIVPRIARVQARRKPCEQN